MRPHEHSSPMTFFNKDTGERMNAVNKAAASSTKGIAIHHEYYAYHALQWL